MLAVLDCPHDKLEGVVIPSNELDDDGYLGIIHDLAGIVRQPDSLEPEARNAVGISYRRVADSDTAAGAPRDFFCVPDKHAIRAAPDGAETE